MFATQHATVYNSVYITHIIEECENMVVAENMCTDMYKSMWIIL